MRVLTNDSKHGIVKVHVDNNSDLWYLSHILSKNDLLSGFTERRIEVNEKEGERKTLFLKIEVEKVDFLEFADVLRVNGKVRESGDDRVPLGSYHSFSIGAGDEVIIEKEWKTIDREYLERSQRKSNETDVLLVSCDFGDATFAVYHDYGIEYIGSLSEELGGKKELKSYETNREKFLKMLLEKIETAAMNRKIKTVLVGGASMITDNLKNMLKDYAYLRDKTTFSKISYSEKNGINELVRKGDVEKVIQGTVYSEQVVIVDKLLEQISKEGLAVYAYPEVKMAVLSGAVSHIIITTNFLKKSKEEETYNEVDELLNKTEEAGGKIHIIDSNTEHGEMVDKLSGIAAIIRYKIN
ncbi:eRF1 domain 1 [Candidatus Tiddalikarchaeum anstoanum]|nr:eRF1 domain 1 [Candidatus Tiddalikarchaeum anstoanum]